MSEQVDFSGLVRTLVEPVVEHAQDLRISESRDEQTGDVLIEVEVHEDDAGKVIGRQGRVIKAIRTLVRAAATRSGQRVDVELID